MQGSRGKERQNQLLYRETKHRCDLVNIEGQPFKYVGNKTHKSNREHICDECKRILPPDTEYESIRTNDFSNDWERYKICSDCLSLLDAFFDSFVPSNIWNDFDEHIIHMDGEIDLCKLAELEPWALEKACELIEEQWEDKYTAEDIIEIQMDSTIRTQVSNSKS